MSLYSQMMTFIAVLEEQSFTKAAEKLAVTPTAVSKQIKNLEAKLGQQLLERDTRKIKVTELGEQFYEHCKRVEQEVVAAKEFVESQDNEPQGELKILVSLVFAPYVLKNLTEFRQRYPKLKINIEIADRVPDLERENIDILVGFAIHLLRDDALRQRRLLSTYYVLCAAKSYLKKYGTPITPQDLSKHKLINHPLRRPINLIQFNNDMQIYMNPPELIINSLEALIQLCAEGAGILQVTEMQVRELLKEKKLIQILPEYKLPKIEVFLFYRHTAYEQKKIRVFIDFILEKMKSV